MKMAVKSRQISFYAVSGDFSKLLKIVLIKLVEDYILLDFRKFQKLQTGCAQQTAWYLTGGNPVR